MASRVPLTSESHVLIHPSTVMWFMVILSWISTLVCISFAVMSVAAGLYYLAELVEDNTVIAGRIIKHLILFSLAAYFLLLLFEDLPISMIACGLVSQSVHLMLMQNFPFFDFSSIPFIAAVVLLVLNHYLAFAYFAEKYLPFSQVLGYFTTCVWLVPLAFFVSLSANDNVLPLTADPVMDMDSDLVSNYLSRKTDRKSGLLSVFNFAKQTLLPQQHEQRRKKGF